MSYKPVKTLGDYIDNTLKHEAMMERQANKKKLTFDEWWHVNNDDSTYYENARLIWNTAQENV